jgi:hypothetical protein
MGHVAARKGAGLFGAEMAANVVAFSRASSCKLQIASGIRQDSRRKNWRIRRING